MIATFLLYLSLFLLFNCFLVCVFPSLTGEMSMVKKIIHFYWLTSLFDGYVLSFWTADLEFTVKNAIFEWTVIILSHFFKFKYDKSANNEGVLYLTCCWKSMQCHSLFHILFTILFNFLLLSIVLLLSHTHTLLTEPAFASS